LEDRDVFSGIELDFRRPLPAVATEQLPEPEEVPLEPRSLPFQSLLEGVEEPLERWEEVPDAREDQPLQAGFGPDGRGPGIKQVEGDHRLRAGVLDQLRELPLGIHGVRLDGDRAQPQGGIEGDDELRDIGEINGDAIALPDAEAVESRGTGLDQPNEPAIADPAAEEDDSRIIGELLRRLFQELEE
jgi:hypothetical protein